jgi:hypothetical protein
MYHPKQYLFSFLSSNTHYNTQYMIMQVFFGDFFIFFRPISHNVPAVYDVFLRPIKKLRSSFRAQKSVPEENRTKAVGRLRFSVGRAAYWRRSIYSPVMRSTPVPHYFYFIFLLYYVFILYFIYNNNYNIILLQFITPYIF